jgi:GDP-L-fucose synthase
MSYWRDKRVVVTGGAGFLGSKIMHKLEERKCAYLFAPRKKDYDLVTSDAVDRLYTEHSPDVLIHLAAVVGGIGANMNHPGKFFYENLMMGTQLMHQAYLKGVKKFVALGTICAYPKFTTVPFKEQDLWSGYPEEN